MIHSLLSLRHSPRAFAENLVSDEILTSLFEAARWSPSARNEQPWRFIVASKEQNETYNKLLESLNEWNQKWAKSAPVLILASAKMNYDYNNAPNSYSIYDLGQAVANLTFQASSHGLLLHQMGGFDAQKAKSLLQLTSGLEPITIIALGYKGNLNRIPEVYHADETKKRRRLPLDDLLLPNSWKPNT
jgi:nitroreductase